MKASVSFDSTWGTTAIFSNGNLDTYRYPNHLEGDWSFEGDLKGGLWAGLCMSFGICITGEVFTENISAFFGPAVEGELKLDFKEILEDFRPYDFIKDHQARTGFRFSGDMNLECDVLGFKNKWKQFKYEPKEWLWQHQLHLVPKFSPLEFQWQGNRLIATTTVSRNTFPNQIGIVLRDDTGKEVTKYADQTYFLNETFKNPMTISFDNLDPKNHIYSLQIVSGPRLTPFEFNVTDPVWATCPDSHHPHQLDLGLPSGTLWSCCNVGAKDPGDEGSYFALGCTKPNYFGRASLNDPTLINAKDGSKIKKNKISGTMYDAAQMNMGSPWCMPSMEQLDELSSLCEIKAAETPSFWWEADPTPVYFVKGLNDNIMLLPHDGYYNTGFSNDSEYYFTRHVDHDASVLRAGMFDYALYYESESAYRMTDKGGEPFTVPYAAGVTVRPVVGPVELSVQTTQDAIDFGFVGSGSQKEESFALRNNSDKKMVFDVSIMPSSSSEGVLPFALKDDITRITLPPHEWTSVRVIYAPMSENETTDFAAAVFKPVEGTMQTVRVLLQGTSSSAMEQLVSFEKKVVDFGQVTLKRRSAQVITLTNNSDVSVFFEPRLSDETDHEVFTLAEEGIEQVLAPGESMSLNVVFKSDYKGTFEGDVLVMQFGTGDYASCHLVADAVAQVMNSIGIVDLGLPSGTYWTNCNLGAGSPEETGDLFAWGETYPKDNYSWSNYKYCNGSMYSLTKYVTDDDDGVVDGKNILEVIDDPAALYGGYRTPSRSQYRELLENTTREWKEDYNGTGVNGWQLTSNINSESIFLPAVGYMYNDWMHDTSTGKYWMNESYKSYAYYLEFTQDSYRTNYCWERDCGLPVRAVYTKPIDKEALDFGEMGFETWSAEEFSIRNDVGGPLALNFFADCSERDDEGKKICDVRIFAKTPDRGAIETGIGEPFILQESENMTFWVSARMHIADSLKTSIRVTSEVNGYNMIFPLKGYCPEKNKQYRANINTLDEPVVRLEPKTEYLYKYGGIEDDEDHDFDNVKNVLHTGPYTGYLLDYCSSRTERGCNPGLSWGYVSAYSSINPSEDDWKSVMFIPQRSCNAGYCYANLECNPRYSGEYWWSHESMVGPEILFEAYNPNFEPKVFPVSYDELPVSRISSNIWQYRPVTLTNPFNEERTVTINTTVPESMDTDIRVYTMGDDGLTEVSQGSQFTLQPNSELEFHVMMMKRTGGKGECSVDFDFGIEQTSVPFTLMCYEKAMTSIDYTEPVLDFGTVAPGEEKSEYVTYTNHGWNGEFIVKSNVSGDFYNEYGTQVEGIFTHNGYKDKTWHNQKILFSPQTPGNYMGILKLEVIDPWTEEYGHSCYILLKGRCEE